MAVLVGVIATCVAFGPEVLGATRMRFWTKLTTLGYGVPGAVLALGLLWPLSVVDRSAITLARNWFDQEIGLSLTGTIVAIVIALSIRFFAIGYNASETSFGKIGHSVVAAGRTLGLGGAGLFARVAFPMSVSSLLAGSMLVFIDAVKELPATLLLRPFGVSTLATEAYDKASLEDFGGAALPALLIIGLGVVSVIIFAVMQGRSTGQSSR